MSDSSSSVSSDDNPTLLEKRDGTTPRNSIENSQGKTIEACSNTERRPKRKSSLAVSEVVRKVMPKRKKSVQAVSSDESYVGSAKKSSAKKGLKGNKSFRFKKSSETKKSARMMKLPDQGADSGIQLQSMMESNFLSYSLKQENNIELDDSDNDIVEDRNLYAAADENVDTDQLSDPGVMMSPVSGAELFQNRETGSVSEENPPAPIVGSSIFEIPPQLDEDVPRYRPAPASKKYKESNRIFRTIDEDSDLNSNIKNSTVIAGGKLIEEVMPNISKISESEKVATPVGKSAKIAPVIERAAPSIPIPRQLPFTKGLSASNPKKGKSFAVPLSRFEEVEPSDESAYEDEPATFSNVLKMPPLPLHLAFENLPTPRQDFVPIEVRLKNNPKFQAKVKKQRAKIEAEKAALEAQKSKNRAVKKPRAIQKKRIDTITPFATNKGNLKFYAEYKVSNEACEKFHQLVDEWADFTLDQVEIYCIDEDQRGLDTKEDVLKLLQRQGIVKNYWDQSGLCHELLTYDESETLLASEWPNGKQLPSRPASSRKKRVSQKAKAKN